MSGLDSAGPTMPTIDQDRYAEVAGPIDHDEIDVAIGVTHAPYRRVIDAMAYDGHDLIIAAHARRPGMRPVLRCAGHELRS